MIVSNTTLEKFENATITGHLDLCLSNTREGISNDYCCYYNFIVLTKLRFQNVFQFHTKSKQERRYFLIPFGLKSVSKNSVFVTE